MIITAKGEKQGNLITVTVNVANHEIEVDGDKKHMYQLLLQEALEESHPIGGTFWPDKKSALHYYSVLHDYFFDELKSIETDEELETIPYEEGVVY